VLLSRLTFISQHVESDAFRVAILPEDDARLLFAAWERAENVYGTPEAVRAAQSRYLGAGCMSVWVITNPVTALAVASDEALPVEVRRYASQLAAGIPLDSGPSDKPDGGTRARLDPPKPRIPPSGGHASERSSVTVQPSPSTAASILGLAR